MKCSRCGNQYCNLVSQSTTKGTDYSICNGLLGEAICGPSGFICGFSDSRKKDVDVYWECKRCGYRFKA